MLSRFIHNLVNAKIILSEYVCDGLYATFVLCIPKKSSNIFKSLANSLCFFFRKQYLHRMEAKEIASEWNNQRIYTIEVDKKSFLIRQKDSDRQTAHKMQRINSQKLQKNIIDNQGIQRTINHEYVSGQELNDLKNTIHQQFKSFQNLFK